MQYKANCLNRDSNLAERYRTVAHCQIDSKRKRKIIRSQANSWTNVCWLNDDMAKHQDTSVQKWQMQSNCSYPWAFDEQGWHICNVPNCGTGSNPWTSVATLTLRPLPVSHHVLRGDSNRATEGTWNIPTHDQVGNPCCKFANIPPSNTIHLNTKGHCVWNHKSCQSCRKILSTLHRWQYKPGRSSALAHKQDGWYHSCFAHSPASSHWIMPVFSAVDRLQMQYM